MDQLRSVLDGEASLQLQSPVVVHHPADATPPLTSVPTGFRKFSHIVSVTMKVCLCLADLYSSSLLTQALTSREGSLASLLIHERADMLQMELPSLTTRRLALVSFPVGAGL